MIDIILTKDSPVYKLFYYPFHCKVPKHATVSYESLERYGTYYAENQNTAPYELIDKMMTINEMVEYFRNGITMVLAKPKEAGNIYEIILEHLKMWRDYGLYFGMPYEPPMEDLYLLDEFAKTLFVLAINYGGKKEVEEDVFDLIEGALPLSDEDLIRIYEHENVMESIQSLKDKYGEYKRYGY